MDVIGNRSHQPSVLGIPTRLLERLRDISATRAPVVLALGAGVQSSAILAGAARGDFHRPDIAIFSDTGWERSATYRHLERLQEIGADAGIPVVRISAGNIRADAVRAEGHYAAMPLHIKNPDGTKGIIRRRQCTNFYKVAPKDRAVRAILGAPISNGRIGPVPNGRYAIQEIGFSADEQRRVLDNTDPHIDLRYPLIEHRLTRSDCKDLLTSWGLGDTPRSSCIGCPFHGDAEWRTIKAESPEEWSDACEVDELLRHGHPASTEPLRGTAFLHRSLKPLSIAPVHKLSRAELKARQQTLPVGTNLEGDITGDDYYENAVGCSPYGCRTTEIPPAAAWEAAA